MIRKVLTCCLLITVLVPLAWSQERAVRPVTGAVDPNIRQALVIGNSEYRHAGRLRNPVNDARAIGNTLQQLGFEVTTLVDADQRKMERAIRDFGDELRSRRGVGLFYYAGHGMQFDGENYLLPTDINPSTEDDVRYDAVPLGKMLAQMREADNKMNVVILDACRNNPFSRSFRTFSPGLAQVNAAAGTFISFATAPGQVAADGDGNNGLFTGKLLEHLRTPGLKIEEVFKRTTADVYTASNERQAPWVQYSVIGDFYFSPGELTPATVNVKPQESNEVRTLYTDKYPDFSDRNSWKTTRFAVDNLIYNGLVRYGLPNGRGSLKYEEAELVGEFVNGFPDGWMTETYTSGLIRSLYFEEGEWVQDPILPSSDPEPTVALSGKAAEEKLLTTNECKGCDIKGALLSGSDLAGVNLEGANLSFISLVRANLRKANLMDANIYYADLKYADLRGANLRNTNLDRTDLYKANLSRANLSRAFLNGQGTETAKFCETTMPDGSFNNRDC